MKEQFKKALAFCSLATVALTSLIFYTTAIWAKILLGIAAGIWGFGALIFLIAFLHLRALESKRADIIRQWEESIKRNGK
jgi:L-lactate permease